MEHKERIIRLPEVVEMTGFSSVTIWRNERAGTFPASVRLGANSKGWFLSEIEAWISNRPRVDHAPKVAPATSEAGVTK